jgi:hypothetical protein
MPIYYALGEALVTSRELHDKEASGQLAEFEQAATKGSRGASVQFSTGKLSTDNVQRSEASGQVVPFEEIAIGKPLTIEIRHVYTGRHPKTHVFHETADMLVTSALKSIATFNSAPRAVNFAVRRVKPNHGFSQVPATDQGTPLVSYSPALTEYNTVLTLEIGFDEFNEQALKVLGNAFSVAAGIPVFTAANKYLLAASAITKIAADLGSFLFDKGPVFAATEPIELLHPGAPKTSAGYRLITDDQLDHATLSRLTISNAGKLVDRNGRPYEGDLPYIVISLDGRANDTYKQFTPTAASAALLDKYYAIREGQTQELGPILDALKLYNDMKFRTQADDIKQRMAGLDPNSAEYNQKKVEYEAAVANIVNAVLRPAG